MKRTTKTVCVIVIGFLFSSPALVWSEYGDIDPTFNAGGVFTNSSTQASVVAVDPANRIVMAGGFQGINGNSRQNIVRFNANGTIDTSFNVSVDRDVGPNNSPVIAIAFQADGKMLIGGRFETVNGQPRRKIARINVDGSLDTSFTPDLNGNVWSIAVQTDNQILLGGEFDTVNDTLQVRLARLSPIGVLDTSYKPAPGGLVTAMHLEADGSLLISGGFTALGSVVGTSPSGLARISNAGVVDTTFLPDISGFVRDFTVQNDGTEACPSCTIVIAGSFTQVGGQDIPRLARIQSITGAPDLTFVPAPDRPVYGIDVTPDDFITVAGEFTEIGGTAQNRAAVLTIDGTVQSGYDLNPFVSTNGFIASTAVQQGGEVLFAGPDYINRNLGDLGGPEERKLIARFNPDGQLDNQLHVVTSGSFFTQFRSIVERPNGKIIVAGGFNSIGGFTRQGIAQLNRDGSVDSRFNASVNGNISSMVLQQDGKLVIAGSFNSINDEFLGSNIVRLNRNGSVDHTFLGDISFGTISDVIIDTDGKILAVGSFTDVNSENIERVVRLEANGAIDPTFAAPSISGPVLRIVDQVGKGYLIGGEFDLVNSNSHRHIARLLPDGTEDVTFIADADRFVGLIDLQSDGRILIGGGFNEVNMSPINNFARLLPDTGNLDLTLNLGLINFDAVNTTLVQPDGKLLLGGTFPPLALNGERNLTRLLPDDSDDTEFTSSLTRSISIMRILRSGKLLIAGNFTTIDGLQRIGLAVLETGLSPFPTDDFCFPVTSTNGKTAIICI